MHTKRFYVLFDSLSQNGADADAAQLKKELLAKEGKEEYKETIERTRTSLPVWDYQQQVMQALDENDFVVISGETGCGKTTQVPQFIFDELTRRDEGDKCNLVCTQPRRIAAISVANRVSQERLEKGPGKKGSRTGMAKWSGKASCCALLLRWVTFAVGAGYQVRLDAATTKDTRLLFCSTGILLRRLHGDPLLQSVSYVIIDEIHERTLEVRVLFRNSLINNGMRMLLVLSANEHLVTPG